MADDNLQKPEDILKNILESLKSDDTVNRLNGIAQLHSIPYSSKAIRNELEKLALNDENEDVRKDALAALDLPIHRNIRNFSKINRDNRRILLEEITEWEGLGLLKKENADVIRRRYDFDFTPTTVGAQTAAPQPETKIPAAPEIKNEGPRPTLLQTLLSEASIKIYLYLGAFFVIASASIIGAVIPELRLPILIIGTLIFGGLSLAIKKRLPQPSFALFIVFSFLILITANTIEEALRQSIDLTNTLSAGYWTFVYFSMAVVWSGSTWLYTSRLFSITAFISLTLAFNSIGKIFDAETEFYIAITGFAALVGLAGVWLLKKWKDANFALPLFLTTQLLQVVILITSISVFGIKSFDGSNQHLWHLASLLAWAFAFGFYILSNYLFPFLFFPWLAAATLIPVPWFIAAAFEIESLGSTIILLFWGAILAIASESAHSFGRIRKYSLPILMASIPTFTLAIITGFTYNNILGLIAAFGIALIYASLHLLRARWWLWTLALLSFIISYFAFFNLEFIQKLDIFIGYQTLGLSILFLLPDLFLKKDLMANQEWRWPPRIYGILFTLYTSIALLGQSETNHVVVCFAIYTLFFAAYAFAQRKAAFGYLPTLYLPLTVIFAFEYFKIDAWLPALTALSVSYFALGLATRSKETWSFMLRNSALALGILISFAALFTPEETGSYGWCLLIISLLFAAEMYLRHDGWFEIGIPVFFTLGTFLILRDFNFERVTYHVFAYSIVWIITDLVAHLTFTNPRPLKMAVRTIGGLFALTSYGFLFAESDASFAATGFGVFTLLFLTVSLLYRRPNLLYAFTLTLPLFVTFLFRNFGITQWIHPVIFVAVIYYALGFFLRLIMRANGWNSTLINSGLGLGVIVSIASPILGGLDASIPVAIAATLWAVEAFAKKNIWLAFPANGLYLLAYFVILIELKVEQPQFFSVGAALLGLLQHYLLTRAESKIGTFIMGMISQFVLLGTTYIQMINNEPFLYFVILFFQALAILVYGLIIRSRSLTLFPIGFIVLGVITFINGALEGVGAIFVIGCTGILLLILGVFAVLMRERISKLSEKISDWKA